MKRFAAEVIFPNTDAAADAAVALAELGLDCRVDPDAVDPDSDYVWAMVSGSIIFTKPGGASEHARR